MTNIAELLKDCPNGMELDCTMYDNVTLERVDIDGLYPIVIATKSGYLTNLTEYGQNIHNKDAKCVIFPKGSTTWEGFVPPIKFKDGDFLTYQSTVGTTIFIHRNKKDEHTYNTSFYVALNGRGKLLEYDRYTLVALNGNAETCLATEEEKEKLLQSIKDNGYEWDADTKTLKKVDVPHTTKKFYIRIGEIPSDEKSAVHRGDAVVGYEDGVSVYDCVETDGLYRIVMPLPLKEGQGMTYECLIQEITQCRYEIEKPRNVYLVSGTEVGKGHDNEPLIKDVKILEDLTAQFNTKSDNTENNIVKTEFRDGDIVFSGVSLISILKEIKPSKNLHCYVSTDTSGKLYINEGGWTSQNLRHATEEEKKKLFDAIKENGYKWNAETKTLESLVEPKFKIGDNFRLLTRCNGVVYTVTRMTDTHYTVICDGKYVYEYRIPISKQDDYEKMCLKFDYNTLVPFESKVLVRNDKEQKWIPSFWGYKTDNAYITTFGWCRYCIPYEGNEHLLGTANDCEEFYKTWKDEGIHNCKL